ncbi:MAG: CRISPR-associated helicase Cas3' [Promethearchaeota archaeon]
MIEMQNAADVLFRIFEDNNEYPSLATKRLECEHPELIYHINRMLEIYFKFKDKLCPASSNENFRFFLDLIIKIAIIFHDLGKLNCFFQWKMARNTNRIEVNAGEFIEIKKTWSYHTELSALMAWCFINYLKGKVGILKPQDSKNLDEKMNILIEYLDIIIVNSILTHHSSLGNIEDLSRFKNLKQSTYKSYYSILVRSYFMYIKKSLPHLITHLTKKWQNNEKFCNKNHASFKRNFDFLENLINFVNEFSYAINYLSANPLKILEDFKGALIREKFDKILKKEKKERKIILFFLIIHLSSVLTHLDKWEATTSRTNNDYFKSLEFESPLINTDIRGNPIKIISEYLMIKKSKREEPYPLDAIRDLFSDHIINEAQHIELNKIYTLTAPCGIGKTLALLNLAFNLRRKFFQKYQYYPRIIYALPFISICDQLEKEIQQIFKCQSQTNILTIHHYLSDLDKNTSLQDEEEYVPIQDFKTLNTYEIKNWFSEIIVTTTIKLFNTLFTFNKKNLMRFHKLANTIIIIDEYHSIPKKYHELVRCCLLLLTRLFNMTFILATATTAGLFLEKDPLIELTSGISEKFNPINRYKLRFHNSKKISDGKIQFCNEIGLEEAKEFCRKSCEQNLDKSIMIVMNTRKNAKEIYDYLVNQCNLNRPICHLSANLIPYHRKKILEKIEKILNNSSKKREENIKTNIVLVTTQLIEAGIDISFQKIIRDLGPLYSIVQVAGRCNRNMEIKDIDKLPIIDIINIENSFNKVYDPIDIDSVKIFLEKLQTKYHDESIMKHPESKPSDPMLSQGTYIEINEKQVREQFIEYPKILNDRKIREDDCYENVLKMNFKHLTKNFKLIKELVDIPIIVIPAFKNSTDPMIKEIPKLITDLKQERRNDFPRKLYSFMTDIYKSQKSKIKTPPFERITNNGMEYYILDLNNPAAKKYYDKKLGLIIE